jgi:hypothetical protein
MKHRLSIAMAITTLCGPLLATAQSASQQQPVGTFDKGSLVLAYYRSPRWLNQVKEKRAEQQAARAAGDSARVKELEKWGRESQNLAHRQLSGKAPLDNILEDLKPAFPQLCRNRGVSAIVADPPAGTPTVDVTSDLMDLLEADARTRSMAEELRAKRK